LAKLHQMNIRFDAEQDRLLWSIAASDGSEIRIWITRRYLKLLLPVLDRLADNDTTIAVHADQGTKQAVKSFQKERVLEETDFASAYQPEVVERPLGEEPVLARQITFKTEGGQHHLGVGIVDGREINLSLDQKLLHAVIKLLDDGARRAEWGIRAADLATADDQEAAAQDVPLH